MIDKTLKAKLLPASLVIKNFVEGEQHCNYEEYLLEFINKSSYFLEKSQNALYIVPESESNCECDCNSLLYKLDFKLIASKTALQGRSIFSSGITTLNNGGIIMTGSPKVGNGSMQTTRIHAALRSYSFEKLCELAKNKSKKQGLENDIYEFLDTLSTKKNLLLFFPYQFEFETDYAFDLGVEQIRQALQDDFKVAMKYRNFICENFDTYLCFIYDEKIVILEEKDSDFCYIDAVSLDESPIYQKLLNYSWPF